MLTYMTTIFGGNSTVSQQEFQNLKKQTETIIGVFFPNGEAEPPEFSYNDLQNIPANVTKIQAIQNPNDSKVYFLSWNNANSQYYFEEFTGQDLPQALQNLVALNGNNFLFYNSTTKEFQCISPAFSNLTGQISLSQIPNSLITVEKISNFTNQVQSIQILSSQLAPNANNTKYLRGDMTWQTPQDITDITEISQIQLLPTPNVQGAYVLSFYNNGITQSWQVASTQTLSILPQQIANTGTKLNIGVIPILDSSYVSDFQTETEGIINNTQINTNQIVGTKNSSFISNFNSAVQSLPVIASQLSSLLNSQITDAYINTVSASKITGFGYNTLNSIIPSQSLSVLYYVNGSGWQSSVFSTLFSNQLLSNTQINAFPNGSISSLQIANLDSSKLTNLSALNLTIDTRIGLNPDGYLDSNSNLNPQKLLNANSNSNIDFDLPYNLQIMNNNSSSSTYLTLQSQNGIRVQANQVALSSQSSIYSFRILNSLSNTIATFYDDEFRLYSQIGFKDAQTDYKKAGNYSLKNSLGDITINTGVSDGSVFITDQNDMNFVEFSNAGQSINVSKPIQMAGNGLWNSQISVVNSGLNSKELNGYGIYNNTDFSGNVSQNGCLFSADQILTTVSGVNYYSSGTGMINEMITYDTSGIQTGYVLAKSACSVTNPFNNVLINGTTDQSNTGNSFAYVLAATNQTRNNVGSSAIFSHLSLNRETLFLCTNSSTITTASGSVLTRPQIIFQDYSANFQNGNSFSSYISKGSTTISVTSSETKKTCIKNKVDLSFPDEYIKRWSAIDIITYRYKNDRKKETEIDFNDYRVNMGVSLQNLSQIFPNCLHNVNTRSLQFSEDEQIDSDTKYRIIEDHEISNNQQTEEQTLNMDELIYTSFFTLKQACLIIQKQQTKLEEQEFKISSLENQLLTIQTQLKTFSLQISKLLSK